MGIPSYFNHIIKKHPNILINIKKCIKYDNLYLDSNSIIYDCLNKLLENEQYKNLESIKFENVLLKNISKKIQEYIELISPTNNIYIAFDGVAPLAKIEQQRTRRYKSYIESNIKYLENNNKEIFNKSSITPGTKFMGNMNKYIINYFIKYKHTHKNIFISGSDINSEGEHKLFEFIRDNKTEHLKENTIIYGLDADLIILSIEHAKYCKNLYLFREKPEWVDNEIDNEISDEYYCMDINELKFNISSLMFNTNSNNKSTWSKMKPNRNKIINKKIYDENLITDYIFLSFILGNDFMPHFPALNIRTNGIDILLETYKKILKIDEYLTKNHEGKTFINWQNLYLFMKELSLNEEKYIKIEEKIRIKQDYNINKNNKIKDINTLINIPSRNRQIEDFIDINQNGWQYRYYNILFHKEKKESNLEYISRNYLEGLEWNLQYYTSGCIDYSWKYKYHYPPLLEDLIKFIPKSTIETNTLYYITKNKQILDDIVQLAYVLPKNSLNLLPKKVEEFMLKKYKFNYDRQHQFVWAFCKYFWESHVINPVIDINELNIEIKSL